MANLRTRKHERRRVSRADRLRRRVLAPPVGRSRPLLDFLRSQLTIAFATQDIQEGVRAFFEKRDPQWQGPLSRLGPGTPFSGASAGSGNAR